jgi:hypothetical protein
MADYTNEVKEQYVVKHDAKLGCFRIIDLRHPTVNNLPLDTDVPDSSPAVKIINIAEANAFIAELDKMGWLDHFKKFAGADTTVAKSKDIKELAIESIRGIVSDTAVATGSDDTVAKEGIAAIRNIVEKV